MLLGGGWEEVDFFLVIPGYLELMLGDVIRKLLGCARCLYTLKGGSQDPWS